MTDIQEEIRRNGLVGKLRDLVADMEALAEVPDIEVPTVVTQDRIDSYSDCLQPTQSLLAKIKRVLPGLTQIRERPLRALNVHLGIKASGSPLDRDIYVAVLLLTFEKPSSFTSKPIS